MAEGMDECDTAALAYQCGQEKAPALIANAIASVERNTSVVSTIIIYFISDDLFFKKKKEAVPLPPVMPFCSSDYECIIDVSYKKK